MTNLTRVYNYTRNTTIQRRTYKCYQFAADNTNTGYIYQLIYKNSRDAKLKPKNAYALLR